MEQLALVLTDIVLLLVALTGGILTFVRARRVGGLAVGLAGAACGLLVLASIIDMVWWLKIFPDLTDSRSSSDVAIAAGIGSFITWLMTIIAIVLLFAATNVGRGAATPATAPITAPAAAPVTAPGPQPGGALAGGYEQPTPPQTQPTPGRIPSQQPQPDWNIHSGVWSIPRGTFDGPPPDQHQR